MSAENRSLGVGGNARGSALIVSLLLLLLLVALGTSLLALSGLEENISHNDEWAEGVLHAADAGLHVAIEQLGVDPVVATQPIAETPLDAMYTFRSGDRAATTPQPLVYLGNRRMAGFGLAVGTGYNPSGYSFARYRINSTGAGPRNTRREVEALTEYGPIGE